MGYESRLYIVDVHRNKQEGSKDFGKVYFAERIATLELSCMGYTNGWKDLFDKPIDYKIFVTDDEDTNKDKYGEIMKSADFDKVIHWLETKGAEEHYRRIAPVLGMLKGFNRSEWDELQIVHFGY